jgi:hypothetical protein
MNTFIFILLHMHTEAKSLPVFPFLHPNQPFAKAVNENVVMLGNPVASNIRLMFAVFNNSTKLHSTINRSKRV